MLSHRIEVELAVQVVGYTDLTELETRRIVGKKAAIIEKRILIVFPERLDSLSASVEENLVASYFVEVPQRAAAESVFVKCVGSGNLQPSLVLLILVLERVALAVLAVLAGAIVVVLFEKRLWAHFRMHGILHQDCLLEDQRI